MFKLAPNTYPGCHYQLSIVGENGRAVYYYLEEDRNIEFLDEATTKELAKAQMERDMKDLPYALAHNFYIGADPEIFVQDKENKMIIPAFHFLKGKKDTDVNKTAAHRPVIS